jgi:hypothetical protein
MRSTRLLTLTLLGLGLALVGVTPATAIWEAHTATSLFLADRNNQPHPESLIHSIVLPADTDGAAFVCVAYGNNAAQKNAGRVLVEVEITRGGGEDEEGDAEATAVQVIEFEGNLKDRRYMDCKATGALAAGDSVVFEYRLRNFQRIELDRPSGTGGFAVISTVGESKPKNPFLPPNPGGDDDDDGGGTGGGGGGGGGGGDDDDDDDGGGGGTPGPYTTADQRAIFNTYKQVRTGVGAQIVVSSMGKRLDVRSGGQVRNFPSGGWAGSFAAAGDSLCRAFPCTSAGISSTLQNNIRRLDQASRSGGRWIIALRQEAGGRWYVDFIKGTTPFHGSSHGSDTAAVNAFCNSSVVGSAC